MIKVLAKIGDIKARKQRRATTNTTDAANLLPVFISPNPNHKEQMYYFLLSLGVSGTPLTLEILAKTTTTFAKSS